MDRSTPPIAVVIPALNAAATIGQQIDAVLADRDAHGIDVDIVVADNGSHDDTPTVARAHGARIVDAAAVRGPAAARNAGARATDAPLILFVDADDLVGDHYLSAMVAALADADLVGANVDQVRLNPGWPSEVRTIEQHGRLPEFTPGRPWVYGATLGIRRTAFDRLGGFDEHLIASEDLDLSVRANLEGLRFGFADTTVHCRLRHTLPDIFRQGLYYGAGGSAIDRKWRRLGVPYPGLLLDRRGFPRVLASSFARLLVARGRSDRASALFIVGRRIGYLRSFLPSRTPITPWPPPGA